MEPLSRRLSVAVAAAACIAGIALPGGVSAAPTTNSQALRDAVNVPGMQDHMAALQAIADANGGTRASGTPGYDASLEYVKDQLEETGYYDVTVQEFLYDVFRDVPPADEMERVSPEPRVYTQNVEFVTMDYSGNGDVTGELVATNDIVIPPGAEASTSNSGCEPGDFTPASETEDQIAMIQRGTCDFFVKAENAEAAGYDAAIIFNEGQEGRQETLLGTLTADDTSTIPVVGTSFADGEELYNMLTDADPDPVIMRMATSGEIRLDQPTANLIADTKTGRTDRTVVVGAHLDSVFEGPGINDNGSGSAQDLEIALQMAELGIEPRNRVRFAWWGAEESGLIGSQFYVDSLTKRQIKEIAVNLNFDMVGSPNYVRFVYDGDASDTESLGSTGSGVVEDIFNDYFASQGLETEPTAFDGRSDYDAFISVGIPAGGLFTGAEGEKTAAEAAIYGGVAGEQHDPCYHEACDTFGSVFGFPPGVPGADLGDQALDEMSDGAAHATLTFAETTSAVQGTDKGEANGRYKPEFEGSKLGR
jgi:Zn-dependent M28 family amino/carboxypeptidase